MKNKIQAKKVVIALNFVKYQIDDGGSPPKRRNISNAKQSVEKLPPAESGVTQFIDNVQNLVKLT